MASDSFSNLLNDLIPLIEKVAVTSSTDNSKWHQAGLEIRSKLGEKDLRKFQKKVMNRIGYHADEYKGSVTGGSDRHSAEVHFMQMLKMHHLLRGLEGKPPKS